MTTRASISLKTQATHIIRVVEPEAMPFKQGSDRDKAWHVVRLMDGLTTETAHQILKALESNIQGKVGRPLGWVSDAIDLGVVKIEAP